MVKVTNNKELLDLIKSKDYEFLRTDSHLGDSIILLALGGSRAYGTNTETSDWDIRGIALNPSGQIYGLYNDFEQVVETNTDTTIYSLNKMVRLLTSCNPNTIEILGDRPEDYVYVHEYGQKVLDIKEAFLSKRAIDSFGGYANAQFNRLEHGLLGNGANDNKIYNMLKHSLDNVIKAFNAKHKESRLDLTMRLIERDKEAELWESMKHTAKSESVGQDLLITGKFNDYPITEFKTLISELHKTQSEFGNINKRNTKKSDVKLAKHMMHLVRLYLMGIELNKSGKIITYIDGENHEMLMEIRNGKYIYDDGLRVRPEFYELLHKVQDDYAYSIENTVLKDEPNIEAINDTLTDIYNDAYRKDK